MLYDFMRVSLDDISKPNFDNTIDDRSCNGITVVINDDEELKRVSFKKKFGVPMAIDLCNVENIALVKYIDGINFIDYFIVTSHKVLEFIPKSSKIIISMVITEAIQLENIINFSQPDRNIFWDIQFKPHINYKTDILIKFARYIESANYNYSLSGLPCGRLSFSELSMQSRLNDLNSIQHALSSKCTYCSFFEKVCDGVSDAKLKSLPLVSKIVNHSPNIIPKVDAVVLYSGGLDSRLSAHKCIAEKPNSSFILIHFSDENTLGTYRVKASYQQEYKYVHQAKGLLLVYLKRSLYHDIINNERILKLSSESDTNLTCLICKALFIYYASVVGKYIDAKTIILGNNQVRGYSKSAPPLPQDPRIVKEYLRIPQLFNMNLYLPLFYMTSRSDVVAEARKLNIELSSSWFSSVCSYGKPRSLQKGIHFAEVFLREFIDSLEYENTSFIDMLERDMLDFEFVS